MGKIKRENQKKSRRISSRNKIPYDERADYDHDKLHMDSMFSENHPRQHNLNVVRLVKIAL